MMLSLSLANLPPLHDSRLKTIDLRLRPHLSVCAAELHFSVVNSVLFATSAWPFSA